MTQNARTARKLQRAVYSAGVLALTTLLLYLCIREIDIYLFWTTLGRMRAWYLWPGVCASSAILVLNTMQFRLFLSRSVRVSFGTLFGMVAVFSMMTNLLPFWGGHALFVYLLGHRERVGKTQALSALTLDQITEGFAKLFVFAVVMLTVPLPAWMSGKIRGFLLIVMAAYSLLFVLAIRYRDPSHRADRIRQTGWKRSIGVFIRWAHHLHVLRSLHKTVLTVALAVFIKGCECVAVFAVQRGFGIDLGVDAAVLMVAALSLSTIFPVTPGRLGIFEGTALLVYRYLGLDPTTAFALGLCIHVLYAGPALLTGYATTIKLGLTRKEIAETTVPERAESCEPSG